MLIDIVALAFNRSRRLSTRPARCFACATVVNAGRAAIWRHGVLCAPCALAYRAGVQNETDDTPAPAGWSFGAGFVIGDDRELVVMRERAAAAGLALPSPRAYTPPAMPVVRASDKARNNAPVRTVAPSGPIAVKVVSPEASNAGKLLAARAAEVRARKLAAK